MDKDILKGLLLIITAVVIVLFARPLRENQRVTTQYLGRVLKIKGPGFVLKLPLIHQQWRKHTLGDRGLMVGRNEAKFQDVTVAVQPGENLGVGEAVIISEFTGTQGDTIFVVSRRV